MVSWNCCKGFAGKAEALAALEPSVAVISEISQRDAGSAPWCGERPSLGLAVLAGDGLEASVHPAYRPDAAQLVMPVRIGGAVELTILAVCARPAPGPASRYAATLLAAIEAYATVLRDEAVVVAGDFNSNALFDRPRQGRNRHSDVVARLADHGLVSAYHEWTGEAQGAETAPTHYWRWNVGQPFHIDYCFIPAAWMPRVASVTVGRHEGWGRISDHMPLIVEVDPA